MSVKTLRQAAVAFAVIAAAGVVPHSAAGQVGGIDVGAMAPSASVETLDGQAVQLSSYFQGKPAVLEFWATWCPLCKELEPTLAAAKERYAGRVAFVGVGVPQNQSPERQKAFVQKAGMRGDFVFDRDGAALAAYKVPHTSYVVILDADGAVVYTGQGGKQDLDTAITRALASGM